MKNMFKSKFSLIAICIVLGILIGSFALCGCRTNYGLLEGMAVKKTREGADGTVTTTGGAAAAPAAAPAAPAAASSAVPLAPAPASDGGAGLAGMGDMNGKNKLLDALKQAGGSANPLAALMSSMPSDASDAKKEGFQVSKPLGWGPLRETEVADVNLTKWVKDAMRYSKGMGNENHLDSYQYNSGPPIPLPEGELFFFKDTKFDPSCCAGTYSSSVGCACLSKKQMQYLTMRGGNNTIPDTKTSYYNDF